MDTIFKIAQEINMLATSSLGGFDVVNVKKKGSGFCQHFKDNPEDVTNNGHNSYHIGSAMYFYLKTISNEKESPEYQEYRFALLVATINLYEALEFGDIQSMISAYRLHLVLVQNPNIFEPIIMRLTNDSIASILSKDSEELKIDTKKVMFYIEYCLFMYCRQDPQIGWLVLNDEEKVEFENVYAEFTQRYKTDNFNDNRFFVIGNKWLNAIISVLKKRLEGYKVIGLI
ncbi:MAG: hypothetical protein ACI3Z8_03465 [Paludibacteraceae bacterium]